jgi:hypothetical protein
MHEDNCDYVPLLCPPDDPERQGMIELAQATGQVLKNERFTHTIIALCELYISALRDVYDERLALEFADTMAHFTVPLDLPDGDDPDEFYAHATQLADRIADLWNKRGLTNQATEVVLRSLLHYAWTQILNEETAEQCEAVITQWALKNIYGGAANAATIN